jgi:hypothetical protein
MSIHASFREYVTANFARALERELAALKAGVARMQEDYSVLQMLYRASINAAVVDPNATKELTALRATAAQLAHELAGILEIVDRDKTHHNPVPGVKIITANAALAEARAAGIGGSTR